MFNVCIILQTGEAAAVAVISEAGVAATEVAEATAGAAVMGEVGVV